MEYIDIQPLIQHEKFAARIVMTNYEVTTPLVFTIYCRRNDGVYKDEVLIYPEANIDYEENVRVFFFGMARSHRAQIMSVLINGQKILPQYTVLDGLEISARYDDSITAVAKKGDYSEIKLDFQVIPTNDPKILMVADNSKWGILTDRTAIIEVTVPGFQDPCVHYLGQNQINEFTSLTLGLNCYDDCKTPYNDLPDGVYNITIKGSPSDYNFNRKYLKTDSIRLELDKMYAKASACEHVDTDLVGSIKKAEFCILSAEANVRIGNIANAHKLLDKANKIIDLARDCIHCL